ncbi:DegT/DnrJ/EryC1/StrS family aminotransferase [Alphaproteobacteria bacterium]|nr:DegT/DnrJ/EryC1/StrS family aminotransferase [Alphaproteobacteria bacterium]
MSLFVRELSMKSLLIKNKIANSETVNAPSSKPADNRNLRAFSLTEAQATLKVPFMDLAYQWRQVRDNVLGSFEDIFDRSAFCLGPYVEKFENEVANYLGVTHAYGVNSGTSAIHLAVKALGLRRGDKVLVPSHTFVGTIWGLIYEGIVPVFCDVAEHCGTIDVDALVKMETKDVRAIIVVHLYGQPANMTKISEFAKDKSLFVIEDVAQAFGASIDGQMLGTIGDVGCFSFYPGKNLGAAGEAGLVITNSKNLAQKINCLRNHGQSRRYVHDEVGFNYRMDGLQAAVLSAKLPFIESWNNERKEIAEEYTKGLTGLPIKLPSKIAQDHVWHLFVIRSEQRDQLKKHLEMHGVSTGLHYPIPLHQQNIAQSFMTESLILPNTETWATQCLSLPIFPGMTQCQIQKVVRAVEDFYV